LRGHLRGLLLEGGRVGNSGCPGNHRHTRLHRGFGRGCTGDQSRLLGDRLVVAVGGSLGVSGTLLAQSIHLVGAGLGDMVPNAAGITEGAYRAFGHLLGVGPAAAISIALVHRLAQYLLAGTSLLVGALWKPGAAPEPIEEAF
jgi:hypothetical protein